MVNGGTVCRRGAACAKTLQELGKVMRVWEVCGGNTSAGSFFHSLSTLYQLAHHTLKKNGSNWAWQPNVWRQRQFVMILTVPKFPKYPSLTHVSFCKQNTPIHPPAQQTQNLYHQIHTVLF